MTGWRTRQARDVPGGGQRRERVRPALPEAARIVLSPGPGSKGPIMPGVAFSINPFEEMTDFVAGNYEREAELGNSALYRH